MSLYQTKLGVLIYSKFDGKRRDYSPHSPSVDTNRKAKQYSNCKSPEISPKLQMHHVYFPLAPGLDELHEECLTTEMDPVVTGTLEYKPKKQRRSLNVFTGSSGWKEECS